MSQSNWVRRYRIAHVTPSLRPWIVQATRIGGTDARRTDWTDVARFHTEDEARIYVANIQHHQFHYLEKQLL